jgi:Fic family protein
MKLTQLIEEYRSLKLHEVIDHDRFNEYAIVHHSSAIEGSTLTENETRLLLEEGVTPKGKPLEHSLMVKDHYEALKLTLKKAEEKEPVSTQMIQSINAAVMKSTGNVYNTALGVVDASKGEFRKGNVSAGGSYFVNYDKVSRYTEKLVDNLNDALSNRVATIDEKTDLAFSAHFDLVSIHPFYDGNGRISRLLMNFIQHYYQLPLARVFKEDKAEYFDALQESRKVETTEPFLNFMRSQYTKHLQQEIKMFEEMKQEPNPKQRNRRRPGLSMFY